MSDQLFSIAYNCMNLADVEWHLLDLYNRRRAKEHASTEAEVYQIPVVLVYGQPDSETMKQFRDRMDYYHHRSGDFVEVFALGYVEQEAGEDLPDFDGADFAKSVESLEERTSWNYSGDTDLIFLHFSAGPAFAAKRGIPFELDFSHAVALTIEDAVKNGTVASSADLFERIFRITRSAEEADFVRALSFNLTKKAVKKGIMGWIAGVFKIDEKALTAIGVSGTTDLRR